MDHRFACSNKVVNRRDEQRRLDYHRARVKNTRPIVDTSEPAANLMDHIRCNMKREQMLEERYSEIHRDNRTLLRKMCDVTKSQPRSVSEKHSSRGPHSLNHDARKREMLRITMENQSILKRIQQSQPAYNHVEFEDLHRRNTGYLKNCAAYPLVLRSARGRPSELMRLGMEAQEDTIIMSGRSVPARSVPPVAKALPSGGPSVLDEGHPEEALELIVNERTHRKLYMDTDGDYSLVAQKLSVSSGRLLLDEPGTALLPLLPAVAQAATTAVADVASAPEPAAPSPSASSQAEARIGTRDSLRGREETTNHMVAAEDEELDADALVCHTQQAGPSVSAEVKLGLGTTSAIDNVHVRPRDLTPSPSCDTPTMAATPIMPQ